MSERLTRKQVSLSTLVADALMDKTPTKSIADRADVIVRWMLNEPELVADAVLNRYQERNHEDGSLDDPYWILPSGEKGAGFSGILERDGFGPSVHDDDFSWDEI